MFACFIIDRAVLCLQLAKQGALNLKTIRHFIIDECDKVLENVGEQIYTCPALYKPPIFFFFFSSSGILDGCHAEILIAGLLSILSNL